MLCGNPPIEQYEKQIINEATQGKKVIVIEGVRYYRTHKYTRKTDGAIVIAYYHHNKKEGFRVELTELGAKVVPMESRKKRKERQQQQAEIQYPPSERHLRELMKDPLTRLNYQIIIDTITEHLGLPRNGHITTEEEIEIPIVAFNGTYRTVTGVIRDIARLFFPRDQNGSPLRVHYRLTNTFETPEGKIVRGRLTIPDQLKPKRNGFSASRYLDYLEALSEIIGIDPAVLFAGIAKYYLGISIRYLEFLIEGIRRFDVDKRKLDMAMRLNTDIIRRAIEASSTAVIIIFGGVEIAFISVDSTKFSRFSTADPLLLLEAIVDVFSGSAIRISLDEKPQPPEPYARFVVLLGDGEYFSEEFLMLVLARGIIPVVRPRKDTPYAEHSKPFLRAYTVFFWRYLWWIYRLRKLVERFFSHLAKRGKLLSRSYQSACREVYFGVLGKNLATCVSLGRLGGAVVVSL